MITLHTAAKDISFVCHHFVRHVYRELWDRFAVINPSCVDDAQELFDYTVKWPTGQTEMISLA